MNEADAEPEQEAAGDRARAELRARDPQRRSAQGEDRGEQEAATRKRDPAARSGGIVSTAILIPKYVEPHTT